MKYIGTLREGERISEIYLCRQRQSAVTKTGKPFESVLLQDKTGTLDGKIWDPESGGIGDFSVFDYVEVMGDITVFQNKLQLSIKRIRKCSEGEYDPQDYIPVSAYDIPQMYQELKGFMDTVENPYLNRLLHLVFDDEDFEKRFCKHSAAKSVHHGFVGGLLEHTLSVTRNCDFFAKNYPMLNRDLLVSAAIFHDIGKTSELSAFPINDYTDAGQLLGHIVIGTEMLTEKIREIPDFPERLANELKHCILAHHGELEYGSPKRPELIEAFALSFADNLDAKMETVREMLSGIPENNLDWLGYNQWLNTTLRRTGK